MDVSPPVSANTESLETNTTNTTSVNSMVGYDQILSKFSSILMVLHILWLLVVFALLV